MGSRDAGALHAPQSHAPRQADPAPAPPGQWGCVRCAQITRTCCQRCEVLVTQLDRERIRRFTGQSDFWEYRAPDDPTYLDQQDDPNWLRWAFRPDGTRPVLRRRLSGDCTFLTPAGCRLPMDVRPLVCRLYPFEYTEAGLAGVSGGCPPAVVPPGRSILHVLDMREAEAAVWHRMLYHELRTGSPLDEDRTHLRPAG